MRKEGFCYVLFTFSKIFRVYCRKIGVMLGTGDAVRYIQIEPRVVVDLGQAHENAVDPLVKSDARKVHVFCIPRVTAGALGDFFAVEPKGEGGAVSDLQKCEKKSKSDHGSGKFQRFICV